MYNLCMTALVFGGYKDYAPYYIYGALKSYPDIFVKVFSPDTFTEQQKECFDAIWAQGLCNFSIIENYDTLLPKGEPLIKQTLARWLIHPWEFHGFDYGYFGDIDILLTKEDPDIVTGHLDHCKATGLPYSNAKRTGIQRLTGLHFIKVNEYYEKMSSVILRYRHSSHLLVAENNDEEFLYKLVSEGIGIPPKLIEQGRKGFYRPHHGIHLGLYREGLVSKWATPDYLTDSTFMNIHNLMQQPLISRFLEEKGVA